MKHQLFAILLCVSCGASTLATSVLAVSPFNYTDLGAAHSDGTDTTTKIRRRRYISQNDMLAILDYHNKVRGRVFPPASNMEYMVSDSFIPFHQGAWMPGYIECVSLPVSHLFGQNASK